MSDTELVQQLGTSTNMIHVASSWAYEAFADGKVIFDISPEGRLLDTLIAQLQPEFGSVIVRRKPFSVPAFPNVDIHTLYHRHKAIEVAMPDLGKIEDEP